MVTSGSRRRLSCPSRETLFLMVPAAVSGLDWVPCLSLSTNRVTMSPPATGHMPGTAPDTLCINPFSAEKCQHYSYCHLADEEKDVQGSTACPWLMMAELDLQPPPRQFGFNVQIL